MAVRGRDFDESQGVLHHEEGQRRGVIEEGQKNSLNNNVISRHSVEGAKELRGARTRPRRPPSLKLEASYVFQRHWLVLRLGLPGVYQGGDAQQKDHNTIPKSGSRVWWLLSGSGLFRLRIQGCVEPSVVQGSGLFSRTRRQRGVDIFVGGGGNLKSLQAENNFIVGSFSSVRRFSSQCETCNS